MRHTTTPSARHPAAHAQPAPARSDPGGTARPAPRTALALGLAALLALGACGGGSDAPASNATGGSSAAATVQLKGTAATGAAIAGATVKAVNAAGASATAVTAADGSYTLSIADGAPFALSVTDAAGKAWYSYAAAAGNANITPLTTLALLEANGGKPLADLMGAWAGSRLSEASVLEAARKLNANLRAQFTAAGLNPASANVFVDPFSANHTGLDAVLDALRVTLNCSASACSQTINSPSGQTLLSWNSAISTTGISLSWTAGSGAGATSGSVDVSLGACKATATAGSYSLVVKTSVAGLGSLPIPDICIDGLPAKPANQAEFCGDATVSQQLPPGVKLLSCSYTDPTGTISAQITAPLVLDYTVSYTFVRR